MKVNSVQTAAIASAALSALVANRAHATVYPDTTGEQFSAFTHLDITSVEVTNNATHLSLKIDLAGDIVATNWGKYMVGIDSIAGGNTTGNGWGRPISMDSGMDFWIGSWVDFGSGFEIYHDNAGAWVRDHATYDAVDPLAPPVVTTNSLSLTFPLAYLNLVDGSVFKFDVYAAGGGGADSANDASSNPAQSITDWPGPYNSAALVSTYTVDIPTVGSTWSVDASGNWSTPANWTGGVPDAAGASATFGPAISSPATVAVDGPRTVGTIALGGAQAYTLAGSALTLSTTSGNAAINALSGSHEIAAPLILSTPTSISVGNAATLKLSGDITGGKVAGISIDTSGKLDITDNKLVIAGGSVGSFTAGAYTGVSGLVDSGRGNAASAQWDGSGIVTSDTRAAGVNNSGNNDLTSIGVVKAGDKFSMADTATATFGGQTVNGADTLVMFTWGGDANLDGKINILDYGQIDFNVGSSGSVFGWYNGDFNYDGKINILDYGIIDFNVGAQNGVFPTTGGAGGPDGAAAVPEPAALSLVVLAAAGLLQRGRRGNAPPV